MSLVDLIDQEMRAGRIELPVLPETALRVRDLIEHDAAMDRLVEVIEREAALATALLRYANSVAFAGLEEIHDLHHAISRLGLNATEHAVLSVSMRNVFRSPDPADDDLMRELWSHSVTVALAARALAQRCGSDPELAFLGGLLHDIGKIVVLRTVAIMKKQDPSRRLSRTSLFMLFDSLHCSIGEGLFEKWKLPVAIREMVRDHHASDLVERPLHVRIVALADRMAARLGDSLMPDDTIVLHTLPVAASLGLGETELEGMLEQVRLESESAKAAL
jgi:putative nucleotidyltransferase with HDIG domain